MLLDNSVYQQTYIEDCEVCCHPIQLSVKFVDMELIEFQADSI
jgi:hypothetical protein